MYGRLELMLDAVAGRLYPYESVLSVPVLDEFPKIFV